MSNCFIIAVDGPSGAGKGELTKRLATHYGFSLLDSGAIYRVLAYAARKAGLALFDEDSLEQQALVLNLRFATADDGVHVILNNEDITSAIRTEQVGADASKVAALPKVRAALLQRQRDFCNLAKGLVADGRDMGTVVFPQAQVKIFLDASCEVRAQRRVLQLQQAGKDADYETVLQEIKERDERDRNRPVAPLVASKDAIKIDSSNINIEEMVAVAIKYIDSILAKLKD